MQHKYYVQQTEPEHQPRQDHTHEVRHRNKWNATVTTRHYSEADTEIERRWRTAHGYRVFIEEIKPNGS